MHPPLPFPSSTCVKPLQEFTFWIMPIHIHTQIHWLINIYLKSTVYNLHILWSININPSDHHGYFPVFRSTLLSYGVRTRLFRSFFCWYRIIFDSTILLSRKHFMSVCSVFRGTIKYELQKQFQRKRHLRNQLRIFRCLYEIQLEIFSPRELSLKKPAQMSKAKWTKNKP